MFDLKEDARETTDPAGDLPKVVTDMQKHYHAFVDTLPRLKPSADYKGADPQRLRPGNR